MMNGAVAGADGELAGGGDRGGQVVFGGADRIDGIRVLREQRGNGGGERAAGAVGVFRGNARGTQLDLRGAVVDHVDAFGAFEVTAFEHHDTRAELVQSADGDAHVGYRKNGRAIEEHFGFREIGRDDLGQRKQVTFQGGDRIGRE